MHILQRVLSGLKVETSGELKVSVLKKNHGPQKVPSVQQFNVQKMK